MNYLKIFLDKFYFNNKQNQNKSKININNTLKRNKCKIIDLQP